MKVSLLIIIGFLCVYTTWVQRTAREVITTTAASEEHLAARLKCSEEARLAAEAALAATRTELDNLNRQLGEVSPDEPRPIAEGTVFHRH